MVFQIGSQCHVAIGDIIRINLLELDKEQVVENLTNNTSFKVTIKSNDVHDLLIPVKHSTSRFPSLSRREGG